MSDEFHLLDGSEFQLDWFVVIIQEKKEVEKKLHNTVERLQGIFAGETAHKIIRIYVGKTRKSFLFNAGFEQNMYNEVRDWMEKVVKTNGYPLRFDIQNFLSYSPPRAL